MRLRQNILFQTQLILDYLYLLMQEYKVREIVILILNKNIKSLELTIKNIPKIDNKIIIGYSNLSSLLSIIKFLEELRTNNDDRSIKILK